MAKDKYVVVEVKDSPGEEDGGCGQRNVVSGAQPLSREEAQQLLSRLQADHPDNHYLLRPLADVINMKGYIWRRAAREAAKRR